MSSQTQGMLVKQFACADGIYHHIYNHDPECNVILMGGMRTLPSNFGKLSNTSTQDYDSDGLLDVEEIDFEASYKNGYSLIYFEEDGTVTLPTYNECIIFFKDEKFYVEKGLERFLDSEEYLTFDGDSTYILPIKSDLTSVDGDGDGISDKYDGYKLIDNKIPDLFIDLVNEEYVSFEDLAFAGSDGKMICCLALPEIFYNVPIDELIPGVIISNDVKEIVSEELENMYIMSYNDGEKDHFQVFLCEDLNFIKKLKYETELVEAVDYSNINWDDINAQYPDYKLTKKAAEYAGMWLKSVGETDEMYLEKIRKACDDSVSPVTIAYTLSGNETKGEIDKWSKGIT